MGEWIKLKASDGFELSAWRADPKGTPRGGIVVIQEIFGVNHHIRSVTDRFAAEGYLAIAPGVFDRVEPRVELAYDPAGIARGMELAGKINRENALDDVSAAVGAADGAGKVGETGFCMGGTYTWLASAKIPGLAAAVGYYGGGILGLEDLRPLTPTMLHFGEKDDHIPIAACANSKPCIPTCRFTSTLPGMAFTVTSAGATMRRARRSPGAGRWNSSASTWADEQKNRAVVADHGPNFTIVSRARPTHPPPCYFTSLGAPVRGDSFSCMTPSRRATSV